MEDYMMAMGSMATIAVIVAMVFGILQIILFFKIWAMTNDIRKIKNKYMNEGIDDPIKTESSEVSTTDKRSIRLVSVLFTLVPFVGIMNMTPFILMVILILDIILLAYAFTRKGQG